MFSRVAVLGSNSFTGAHFVDYVLAHTQAEVRGYSRSPEYDPLLLPYRYRSRDLSRFEFQQLDVNRDFEALTRSLDEFEPDLVYNLAAQGEVRNSWRWPEQWYQTNTLAVVRLAEFLKDRPYLRRYLTPSTPEVYGTTGPTPVAENHNYQPSTPYGVSKLAGEMHLMALHRKVGFPVVQTRAANLYGIHQQLYRIIPKTAICLKLGQKLTLHGRGQALRAFIHAQDVAHGSWLAASGPAGEIYHLAPPGGLKPIAEVVELICRLQGQNWLDWVELSDENFGQDGVFSLDSSKAQNLLNWQPRVNFEDGVRETLDWLDRHWTALSQMPHDYQHKE